MFIFQNCWEFYIYGSFSKNILPVTNTLAYLTKALQAKHFSVAIKLSSERIFKTFFRPSVLRRDLINELEANGAGIAGYKHRRRQANSSNANIVY